VGFVRKLKNVKTMTEKVMVFAQKTVGNFLKIANICLRAVLSRGGIW